MSVEVSRIHYGSADSQFVDLLRPSREKPFGTVFLLHGGWWRTQHDLHLMDGLVGSVVAAGYMCANVEYRRIGDGGGWPVSFDDVGLAVEAVRNADPTLSDLGAVAIGHSAGGHLALLSLAAKWVSTAVALAPITDLRRCALEGLGEGATTEFIGRSGNDARAPFEEASPLDRLPIGGAYLVVHGDDDARVPVQHSRAFTSAARAQGDDVTYIESPATDHFQVIDPAHKSWAQALVWMDARCRATQHEPK